MAVDCLCCRRPRARRAGVQDLKGEVVGNGADQGGMERMVLDVVYDRGVMGINSGRMNRLVIRVVLGNVPKTSAKVVECT